MPKEIVNNRYDGLGDSGRFRALVLWGRDKDDLQLATVKDDPATGAVEEGLFVDLDRHGVNQLIRVLRKARDQAFGADA